MKYLSVTYREVFINYTIGTSRKGTNIMETTIIENVPMEWIDHCEDCGTTMLNLPVAHSRYFRVILQPEEIIKKDKHICTLWLSGEPHPVIYEPGEVWGVAPQEIEKIAEACIRVHLRKIEEKILKKIKRLK